MASPVHSLQFFPKRLFRKFVLRQFVLVVPVVILGVASFRFLVLRYLSDGATVVDSQPVLEAFVWGFGLALLLAVLLVSIYMGWRIIFPLGRLILKARSMTKRDELFAEKTLTEEEEEAAEWGDLESALDRLQTELWRRSDKLSRERTENRALMNAITDAVVAARSNEVAVFYNAQLEALFPWDRDEHGSRPALEALFRDHADILESFRRVMKDGRKRRVPAVSLPAADGSGELFYELSIAPLERENGSVYGVLGIFHDITDLKRTEQIRIDFVSNVSHELRTPLTSIKGYSDTLMEDLKAAASSTDPQTLKHLGTIARNADRLMNLVNDLLDLSSLESGGELRKTEVDVREFTDKIVGGLKHRAEERNLEVETRYELDEIFVDDSRVEQVLVNLVENAIKYIPEGSKIAVEWSKEGETAVLRVADNGPGIPLEHLPRLFERFYRVDKARSRQMGGTGLGLAIVKHIMQRHGGSVDVESEPGQGTTFLCRFPLDQTAIESSLNS